MPSMGGAKIVNGAGGLQPKERALLERNNLSAKAKKPLQAFFGKNIAQEQGKILFHKTLEIERERERGWSR